MGGGRAEVFEPVEAPLEGADDSVGVSCSKRGFPGKHPLCVQSQEHIHKPSKVGLIATA